MDETRPLDEGETRPSETVAGQTFGRYVLVRRIGAGGCGEVFAAYDPVLDRRIALKILFRGGHTGWAREARMLAKVDHPQVVTVHDAGVEDGQGYLATELIDGPSLDRWLSHEGTHVSPMDRLALLLPIAAALGEAHARGIVHGDVKPANILVAASGARITDFGVARAIDQEGASESAFAGTPAYMAPEQLEGKPATEASDQYAFCLTLCQALSNEPLVSEDTDRDERGSETRGPGESAASRQVVPTARRIPAAGLDRAISGALRRGLEADPARRFASMAALVDAMVTVPQRRRRTRRVAAAAVVLSAAVGAVAYGASRQPALCTGADAALAGVWNDAREDAMRDAVAAVDVQAVDVDAESIAQALDAYAQAWKAQHTEICEATSVRKEQSEATMDVQMMCMARARGRFDAAVDIFIDADEGVLRNANPTLESLIPLPECLDLELLAAKKAVPIPKGQQAAVDALDEGLARSHVQLAAGRFREARDSAAEVLAGAREIGYDPMVAEGQYQLAASMAQRGDFEDAKPRGREALRIGLEYGQIDLTLMAASLLAFIESHAGTRESAQAYETMALGLLDRPEIAPRLRTNAMVDLATVVYDSGRFLEARTLYEQALEETIALRGEDDWRVPHAIDNIAMADMSLGNDRKALEGFERAMALREASVGETHVNHVLTLLYLGGLRVNLGELDAAARDFERARRITESELSPKHAWFGASTDGLARVALEQGDLAQAQALAGEAVALFRETLGDKHAFVANSLMTVGRVAYARGEYAAAEPAFVEMVAIMKPTMGTEHPLLGEGYRELGRARIGQQRWDEALEAYDAAWAIEEAVGIPPVERVDLLSERGLVQLRRASLKAASADLAEAAALLDARTLESRDLVALYAQASMQWAQGNTDGARTWLERARSVANTKADGAALDAAVARREGDDAALVRALELAGHDADVAVIVATARP